MLVNDSTHFIISIIFCKELITHSSKFWGSNAWTLPALSGLCGEKCLQPCTLNQSLELMPIHIQNSVILPLRANFRWIRKDGTWEKDWFCCNRGLYSKMGKAQLPRSKIIINPPWIWWKTKIPEPCQDLFSLCNYSVSSGEKLILPGKFLLSERLLSLNCNRRVTIQTQRLGVKSQPRGFWHHLSVYKPSSTLYIND